MASSPYCRTFHVAIELIGKRWNGAIVAVLMGGPRRFGGIAAAVPGLSERLLSERLRELEANGIVTRRVLGGPPLGVEYTLTEAGRELAPVVHAVSDWGHRWLPPALADDAPGPESSELLPGQPQPAR